jgi:uncharacterized NAD(P)/FAD-binding protein YdhS
MKKVAIVGGGFSGTMAAVNLARLSDQPVEIVLINHRYPLGRGVAYGTKHPEHVLNVAARNMSAVPDHPQHFMDWLRTRVEYADLPEPQLRETFVPRRIYGDYLKGLLLNYLHPLDDHHPSGITVIEEEATDIAVTNGQTAQVFLRNGETLSVDRVLLATGNQPPAPIGFPGRPFTHPAYCSDPWQDWPMKIPKPDRDIIVLGTGLTMVDVFLTLTSRNWPGNLIAISRNGMIPQSHFRGIEYPDFLPAEPEELPLDQLVALLEDHCERLRRLGENPGLLVDRLRPFTQRIWQRFTIAEKKEFLGKFAPRWNVIRHRIAQPIHQRLTEAITEGQVRIIKGNILGLAERGELVEVAYETPKGEDRAIQGGLVINCTGPCAGFSGTDVPLFQNLLKRGLIRPDELDMGIDVGAEFAVIDREGRHSECLFAIGPLMKGTLWETTAVPELRGQAMRVAQIMLEEVVPAEPGHDYRFSVEEEHVIEYFI